MAVFGFLAMGDHGPSHDLGGCIAALREGTDCSAFRGLIGFASFHLSAFKVFSSANFSVTTAMSLLLFLVALIASTILAKRLFNFEIFRHKQIAVLAYSSDHDFYKSLETSFRSWFAMREMRDAVFSI
ncbi:MAG: hypothetical protein A2918_01075 [Candidatus Yanofskybacteria bacterium RIFCSPLOWO2_01_FULL_42_49]|uniref:Uncharacterized protein n=1 Tax=Candidatus Yanofskybacteria bacterium RIFCSPLOWO2_01_FULL_42_49 TaxID=1802694 RepID=A0A1F8GD60_9BACT|nr:MAG: hypothetical protein A2918_01075 [Candidatus Yanofskybacteria bacterium RIFCSPLOWO2_01_FULL_42_49]